MIRVLGNESRPENGATRVLGKDTRRANATIGVIGFENATSGVLSFEIATSGVVSFLRTGSRPQVEKMLEAGNLRGKVLIHSDCFSYGGRFVPATER